MGPSAQTHHINYHLTPQPPEGTEVRSRRLTGKSPRARKHKLTTLMTCGAFFDTAAPAGKMRQGDLAKVAALTVDVDFLDHPGLVAKWQGDSKERKARLYAMSQDEVLALMGELGFILDAIGAAHVAGLPARPNRTLFTGHGCCMIYWCEDALGWASPARGNGWTPARMKTAVKRWHADEAHDLWWWDKAAKDTGTRIFPIPGECHREVGHQADFANGKTVFLLEGSHDMVDPLTPWFEALEVRYPRTIKKARSAPTGEKKVREAGPRRNDEPWSSMAWLPEWDEGFTLEVDGRGTCPMCDTETGLRRMEVNRYACFHCRTQMHCVLVPVVVASPEPDDDNGLLRLDDLGRAIWPDLVPRRTLLKGRTGVGKTWLMGREKDLWLSGNDSDSWRGGFITEKRVIAVSPYSSLSAALADRLEVTNATPDSQVTWRTGSLSTTFASLARVLSGMTPATLANTMILVDESEQMLQQLQGMLTGEAARETYGALCYALAHAGRVILADAHAAEGTSLLIEHANVMRGWLDLPPAAYTTWDTAPHTFTFRHVAPVETMSATGRVRTVESAHRRHLQLLHDEVGAGKKVAVVYFSKNGAKALGAQLAADFPAKSVRVVVGGRGYEETHDFSEDSLKHDVLIYNIAMGTGVSFDVADWYDCVHVVLDKAPQVTGPQVEQAIHRIRKPKSDEYVISGSWAEPDNDWRKDASLVLARAVRRWESGAATAKAWGDVEIVGNFHADPATHRLTVAQAVNEAEAAKNGRGGVLSWLARRHTFKSVEGCSGDFAADVATTKDLQRRMEATQIATAEALTEEEHIRVTSVGHKDEDERIRHIATILGETYATAWTDGDDAEKYEIAFAAQNRRLTPKTRLMAAARLVAAGKTDVVAKAERRYNSHRTAVTARTWTRDAAVIVDLFNYLGTLPVVAGRVAISREQALACVASVQHRVTHAGRALNEDWQTQPIKQLQMLLAWVNLKMGCTRSKVDGRTVRNYWFAHSSLNRMGVLSDGFVTRWLEKAEEEDKEAALAAAVSLAG